MASLQRKNTVSRSSGPSHMNSYALRGVPIKYKPPIFVPELLYLPASWKPPEMLSAYNYGYNYSLENAVIAQARSRALSIAAEESLKRQQIEELQRQQREREKAEEQARKDSAPLIPLGNDILTPTPVATAPAPAVRNTSSGENSENSDDLESPKSTSGVELTMEPPIKSLGHLSIREFEATTDDPFEIASLQAINDMEVLQSVLQPIPPPILTINSSSSSSPAVQASVSTTPAINTAPTRAQSSPIPAPRTNIKHSREHLSTAAQNSSGLYPSSTPPGPVAPIQSPQGFDPFAPNNVPVITGASSSEPGVGLLIDIGGDSGSATQHGRTAVDQPQGSPVPKPRTHTSSSNVLQTTPYPNGPSSLPNPSPPVPPKAVQTATTPTQDPVGGAPIVPPKPAIPGHVRFTASSNPPTSQAGHNRLGLGVQVLPPIPTSAAPSAAAPLANVPPPPYSSPASQHRMLPPYSSPKVSPKVAPKTYKLPDPLSSLNSSQRGSVDSLSGMGFPPPRVARAVLRYDGDNTKVLDFLFLVGQLEEQKFSGDSAETALIACKEDVSKAVEYLKEVERYKEFGFPEKKIHEAYENSSGDWDKALDLLTEQGR